MRELSRQYAERVLRETSRTSTDPLYSGQHLEDVSEYLRQPTRSTDYEPGPGRPFVHLYNLDHLHSGPQKYSRPGDFESECERQRGEQWHKAGLLFLTGHATPAWLNAVGGEFDISPLHLRRHLNFRPSLKLNTYAFPTLPSASSNVLTLTIPTIGHIEPQRAEVKSAELQAIRRLCDSRVQEQSRVLEFQNTATAGEPVIRRLYLHDMNTFTIEQDITISLVESEGRWTVLIMCDSNGDGAAPIPPLPRLDKFSEPEINYVPVIQMNRQRHAADVLNQSNQSFDTSAATQSLALLPSHYGSMLDSQSARNDPFYALYELFDFYASAESQCVNLMRRHVNEQVNLAGQDREGYIALSDFQYTSEILNTHTSRLKRLLTIFNQRSSFGWPQPEHDGATEAEDDVFVKLTTDLQYLLDQVEALRQKCDGGRELVLGRASILIAEQSHDHNVGLGQLTRIGTWIAILYVPWSFLTAVFGMNFQEFGQGPLSIWVWAATSAISLGVGLLVFAAWRWRWILEKIMEKLP